MIKLQVIGHLGRDAVVNTVSGRNVINFPVAHSEKYKDAQGNQVERTTWVDCAYWTDKTGIAPYLKKGSQVFAEGAPEVKAYTTQDGKQGATLILKVFSVQLLGNKNNDGTGSNNYQSTNAATQPQQQSYNTPPSNFQPAQQQNGPIEPLDDLPF
jgi:single-strand DNA-binding protein